jgi:transcriptional regulator with XRE-family HTH domain
MMKTNLAQYIKQERIKQGLNYAELSRKMNYTNINRGMRRIIDLEREGEVHHAVLKKVAMALELDEDEINKLIMKDEEERLKEFDEWVNEPIDMYYRIRMIPTIYLSYDLPSNITSEDEAITYISDIAKKMKCLAWLNLSRREKVFIDRSGGVTGRHENGLHDTSMPYLVS